jgi:uncharacterized membrane protein YdjX (TVP38/TMEM64 family)
VKTLNVDEFLSFEYIKHNQKYFEDYYTANVYKTLAIFFFVYVLTTALSIPGATILSLLGGALFGFPLALLLISFSSTLGATFAFWISRTLLRDFIQTKYNKILKTVNTQFEREGAFYLFTLRLIPVFPFFLINLVMGLTRIGTVKFFYVSQLGMLAGTAVYVNAGAELGQMQSMSEVMGPGVISSLAILGLFPLIAKRVIMYYRSY